MDNKKSHILRKRLDSRIIKLVAPAGMSIDEYKIACNLNGIDPTVEAGPFLHWVMTTDESEDLGVVDKVRRAIVSALEKKYLIDTSSQVQCSYFCDAVQSIITKNKWYAENILEAVLKNYKDAGGYAVEVFNYCKRLNKAFGLTEVEYFNDDILNKLFV